jgi:hypothetical protein
VTAVLGLPVAADLSTTWVATSTTTPSPTPGEPDPDTVTPGLLGFLVVFLLAIVTWLLLRNMTARLRRLRFREEQRLAAQPVEPVEPDAPQPPDGPQPPEGTAPRV